MNKKAKASNRFVGYIRVSTDKQAESGLGLMDQRLLIKEKVERMGGELVAVHDDAGKSGSLPLSKRPGLQAAISMMEPGDTLVVAKRDRLARDMLIVMMIERELSEMGCRVVSASGEGTDEDTPEARLMRHFIDAISEYQRLVTKIRTRNAFAIKRSKGEYCGGEPPFGFRVAKNGVKLEPEPRERATMEQAGILRAKGLGWRRVAETLNRAHEYTRSGTPWSHDLLIRVYRKYRASVQAAAAAGATR